MVATTLDVVNDCLAVMGEAPLNDINEDHAFKTSALDVLKRNVRDEQSVGWWFNQEELLLRADATDGRVYLPTDVGRVLAYDPCGLVEYAQRGRTLYNLTKGTDLFAQGFTVKAILVRLLAFEDLPNSANAYIGRKTVLDFQMRYDGDTTKTSFLKAEVYGQPSNANTSGQIGLKGTLTAEHIRNKRVNFINQSERLSRVTNVINYSRRPR